MRKTLLCAVLALAATGACAQTYKWVDRSGHVQYGDTPPSGTQATLLRGSVAPAAQPAESKKLSPAEQDAEFRKRQAEAQKARDKQAQTEQDAAAKKENCARAQESLRTLQSGQRISRTDANGERYYLDDSQISDETAKARQRVQEWCT